MGTNFYVKVSVEKDEVCHHCGTKVIDHVALHIGKRSAGMVFALAQNPEYGIFTPEDWERVLSGRTLLYQGVKFKSSRDIRGDNGEKVRKLKKLLDWNKDGRRHHNNTVIRRYKNFDLLREGFS